MARVVHLFKGDHVAEARTTIEPQVRAGDQVTVALLGGAAASSLPPGVEARRVPEELSYQELLELIFAADHVVTW